MSNPDPRHDPENVRTHDSKFAPKKKNVAKKMAKKKPSFIDQLEAHKSRGRSLDSGAWKPSKKGQTFIQALEEHRIERAKKFM